MLPRNLGEPSEPEAVQLLRQMLRPRYVYVAKEHTWIAQGGGMISIQSIKGDTNGNVIRRYESPGFLAGDVMLTGPNKYAYYRASTHTLTEVRPKEGQEDERDKKIVGGIQQRIFVARRTGVETVAGCSATIVLVSSNNPQQQGYAKFWIDPSTHIKLKVEIANEMNSKVSTSELSDLVVGQEANVLPRDFSTAQFGGGSGKAATNEVTRDRVGSIQEALPRLSFHPLQPGNLPPGFRLEGVQIVEGPKRVGLFLRYTDGVSFFTLTEHRLPVGARSKVATNPGPPHWFVGLADYDVEVVYRGHLSQMQEQQVHDSLQPVH